jgi:hypothetical protein
MMNSETLNRYVLLVIGLFAVLLYLGTVIGGAWKLVSRMPMRKITRKRTTPGHRRLRGAKRSA